MQRSSKAEVEAGELAPSRWQEGWGARANSERVEIEVEVPIFTDTQGWTVSQHPCMSIYEELDVHI